MLGGAAAWIADRFNKHYARNISLVAVIIAFAVAMVYTAANYVQITSANASLWLIDYKLSWIPAFGISFHLAMDGLSLIMVLLTLFLGVLSVLISWKEIKDRTGFYYFNLLWILAGIIGVFTAVDLFLFYFFWEIMLIPMYFLIGIWGHERKIYAAYKFFIYTQASGLLMFLAILGLYFIHGKTTGVYSFDYFDLLGTKFEPTMGFLLMGGFLLAFTVKLPIVPLHNWLPDAHTQAPTAGSLILAGLLLKTGAYGIIRFAIPFFPDAAHAFAPYGMIIGTIGILYGAKLAYSQTDLKRLVAYTSVSHMGFVMLGVWAFNELAYQGVVMQMVTHGISTGALFILVGFLYERTHTRDINSFGGLWAQVPKLGSMMLVFALASLGLPGLGNFIAEFLVLSGSYQANMIVTAIASIGLVLGTVYSLRIFQRVFQGPKIKEWTMSDLSWREAIVIGSLVLVILWLGLYPQPVIDTVRPVIANVLGYL
jgi:NADH-quinone oxidoreductase subunit M